MRRGDVIALATPACWCLVALGLLTLGLAKVDPSVVRAAPADEPPSTAAAGSAETRSTGVLPCAGRRLVLTTAYRDGDAIRFQGVAKLSAAGGKVRIRTRGTVLALTTVRPDGTFAVSIRDTRGLYRAKTRFTATTGGSRSWPRRLAQAVEVLRLHPEGSSRSQVRIRVRGRSRLERMQRVVVARQVGCRKQRTVAVKQLGTASSGRFRTRIRRPQKGQPYAIYRLVTLGGAVVSAPIVVRAER